MWRLYSVDGLLFALHRVTGVGLFLYLLAHIWTISTAMLGGPAAFDRVMTTLASPSFRALDVLLLGSLIFHAVNGLRLMAHERGMWLERADAQARTTVTAWLGLWGACALFAFHG